MHYHFNVYGHRMAALDLNPHSADEPIILLHGFSHSIDARRTDTAHLMFIERPEAYADVLHGWLRSTSPCRSAG